MNTLQTLKAEDLAATRLSRWPQAASFVELLAGLREGACDLEALRRQTAAALTVAAEDSTAVRADAIVAEVADRLPELFDALSADAAAALDRDPAAKSLAEVVLCYPGFEAVAVHRLAHALETAGAPLLPRALAEWAHGRTGIDIHPGARIGAGFFIDHGTGTVIGETARLGADVTLYQGVTLGARAFERDGAGQLRRGTQRHPTLEDGVTVYAHACILGGDTVIGARSVIGARALVCASVPPDSLIRLGR